MNAEQAAHLCKLAKTISPSQAIDEFTPAAWALILEDIRFEDAREALKQLGGEQTYIHVSDIVKRVARIRSKRVADFGPLPDPPRSIDPDDTAAHIRWLDATTEAIADGTYQRPAPEAIEGRRDVIRELGQAGTSVNSALAIRNARKAHAEAIHALQEVAAEEKRAKDDKRAAREAAREADRVARAAATTEEVA